MKKIIIITLLLISGLSVSALSPDNQSHQTIAEQVRGTDSSSTGFVADVLTWYDAHMNYSTVGLLMALESSFVPFPSEVVIPPAVYVACNPDTRSGMTIWVIVLIGTLGALIGAYINYFLSRWLGRPIIYAFAESKVGHLLNLSKEKVQRAESYFNDHGNVSTLVGRLIPVIRQLISIPAGLSKMNLATFTFFTLLGAGAWNVVLALLGWLAYKAADPSVIEKYSHQFSVAIVVIFAAVVVFLIIRSVLRKRKQKQSSNK
jgi:membrane protein DedA with SNARE-associated domain